MRVALLAWPLALLLVLAGAWFGPDVAGTVRSEGVADMPLPLGLQIVSVVLIIGACVIPLLFVYGIGLTVLATAAGEKSRRLALAWVLYLPVFAVAVAWLLSQ